MESKLHLRYGQLLLTNITNKKGRSNPMKREIKALEVEVKAKPDSFYNKSQVQKYHTWIKQTKSAVDQLPLVATDSAALILTRLIIDKGNLPTISRVVDSMNYISVKHGVAISIWDQDRVKGAITYKMSKGGEKYKPFMSQVELELLPNELAAFDETGICRCLVRYRDSDYASVEVDTRNICVHMQFINPSAEDNIEVALSELEKMLIAEVGGTISECKIFNLTF
jgi:DNA/RNA-binding domain of Phe-tRNA-synthetase-like protein